MDVEEGGLEAAPFPTSLLCLSSGHYEKNRLNIFKTNTNNTFCYYLVNKDLKIQISERLFFVKSISRKKFREIG